MVNENIEGLTLDVLIKKQHYTNLINKVKDINGAISVCKELNIDISHIIFEKSDYQSIRAFKELEIITRALNEVWKPNWNDANEYKYYNYFYMNNGTFSCDITHSNSSFLDVPSALWFKSCELAEYAGKMFIELYKNYYNN